MMKKRIVVILCLIVAVTTFVSYYVQNNPFRISFSAQYVPFDESMLLSKHSDIVARSDFLYVYNFLKELYEKNSFAQLQPEQETRIPKILHIMWLGGKLPTEYDTYVASWKRYHPDWTILFWTDNELNYDKGSHVYHSFSDLEARLKGDMKGEQFVVDARNLEYDNKIYYDRAKNYGERSDILKWEIVYQLGGVYVDTDFECLRSLDVYNHTYDFYTGIQPLDTNIVQLVRYHVIHYCKHVFKRLKTINILLKLFPKRVRFILREPFWVLLAKQGCVILRCRQVIFIHVGMSNEEQTKSCGARQNHMRCIIGQEVG